MSDVAVYIDEHLGETIDRLAELCRLPSVSAQDTAIIETARHVEGRLREIGFATEIVPKPEGGHPVVLAERDEGAPRTLLLYNHYDVQPPEPLDLWSSPPFQPEERDGRLYARGVSDNKGNIEARIAAIAALLHTRGSLPANVRWLIEGDEEVGSPNLTPFVERHAARLRADACLWEGSGVDWDGRPQVTLGVKGLLYVQLDVRAAARDSHSSWAPVVPNAAWRMTWALASLKDPDERVLIDGFYDDVRPATPEEEQALAELPDQSAETARSLEMPHLLRGATGIDYQRRYLLDPTCTIDGIDAGYQGPGAKTVLPATASAKVEFRLVPDQDPNDLLAKLRRHLDDRGFDDVAITCLSAEGAARTPVTASFVRLVRETGREVYGADPAVVPTMAGTGPLHPFVHILGLDSADCGVGNPDSRIHAPDENIRIDDLRHNVHHVARLIERFARGS